jgi:hypothetical protein
MLQSARCGQRGADELVVGWALRVEALRDERDCVWRLYKACAPRDGEKVGDCRGVERWGRVGRMEAEMRAEDAIEGRD